MNNKLIAKTLSALEAVASAGAPASFKELATSLKLPPSTLSRILSDLAEAGYIRKSGHRRFEPALGLIGLGQMATLNCYFPKKVNRLVYSRCKATGFKGALAGLFRDRLVYLYRSSHGDSPKTAGMPYANHPHSSNIALIVLAKRYGKERALSLLERSIRRSEPTLPIEERMLFFSGRIDEFLAEGHSTWIGSGFVNSAIPIEWQGDIWGLSLVAEGAGAGDVSRLTRETAALADSINEMLLN